MTALRNGLALAIERANTIDGTDADNNATREQMLSAAIIGINVSHRRDPTDGLAAGMIDGVRDLVESWRRA